MSEICDNCLHSYERKDGQLVCDATLPTNLARALGFDSGHDIPEAITHWEWTCALWKEKYPC